MPKRVSFNLRIEHLWGLVALAGIFIFVSTHPIRPHDFWWHITIGREILKTGSIPVADIYSYTSYGQPYPSYSMFWMMEILLYEMYKLGGVELVILVHSLIITSAYGIVFWICKQVSKSWRIAAFSVLFAAALGLNDWNVRPQGITFLLASLFMLAIFEYHRSNKWGWLAVFPLGMVVWANSHGSFLIGIALIGIWFSQEVWNLVKTLFKRTHNYPLKNVLVPGAILVITTLTCLINPRGFGIISYVRTLTGNTVIQNLVTEWAPPRINTLMGGIFFAGLVVSGIILIISPRRPGFSQVFTFLVFGILGVRTSRGSVWFGLVMAPVLAEHLTYIIQKYRKPAKQPVNARGSRLLNVIFTVVILTMLVLSIPWFKSTLPLPKAKAGLISAETPIQATKALLAENPPQNVFNSISFGSYLIWSAYPEYRVFVDPRIELFPEEVWMDYLNISNAVGDWEAQLKDYDVNTLMLSPIEQPGLIKAVEGSENWELLYQDENALIYTRR